MACLLYTSLSAQGLAQLRKADIDPKVVYISTLQRTKQTAEVLFPQDVYKRQLLGLAWLQRSRRQICHAPAALLPVKAAAQTHKRAASPRTGRPPGARGV